MYLTLFNVLFSCYPPLTESNDYQMIHEVIAVSCCGCIYTDHNNSMINVSFLSDYHLEQKPWYFVMF